MNGWTGKILHVDLTSNRIGEISTKAYAERYLGGRGLASRLYYEKMNPDVSAFDPRNRLIFMTGPILATGVQGAARMSVSGKSPMAYPERYCYGSIGGYLPSTLKRAGWDGIVVDGRASSPLYLTIDDNKVALDDASWLWGQNAYKVLEMLREKHGENIRFVTTGVAGENLVRSAVLFGSHQAAVTAGFGAVMASKNLKAITVRGTGQVSVYDRDRLKELNRYTLKINKRISLAITPDIDATGHGHILEVVGRRGCFQCSLECSKYIYRMGKDPDLQGLRGCQSMEYYMPWVYGYEDEPLKTVFDAPTMANDYSIGTFELQNLCEWLFACYRAGALTEKETGLPLSKMGTREFLEKLLHSITYRKGFGDLLAEGLIRASRSVPESARNLLADAAAPIGRHDNVPPRAYIAHALLYPFETRMHPITVHELIYTCIPWKRHNDDPESFPITPEKFCRIAEIFWGSRDAADQTTYRGKALAARNIQNRTYLRDSLGLCDFVWPVTYSLNTPDNMGDPNIEGEIFTAVTGIPASKLDSYAERIFNMQRIILVREGHRIPEDDYPPEFNFTVPLKTDPHGAPVVVPGPDARPVSATGRVLDREKVTDMLMEFYELRGWDKRTGLPTKGTLTSLGMDDIVE